ncbi:MAG: pyridoxal phosphate-dependent aminotransferase [Alphaproteobacteria bacterium]|nr:pyridoxal phosphate-dependent aminotransferase [Alphaproteobacteria bacterium]
MLKLSKRSDIAPFIVMDVLRAANQRAAAGADVLHLEIGQPATPAPAGVIEAAKRALDSELIGYTDALGIPPLRARIARYYQDMHDLSVDPDRIAITTGSSAGFVLAFLACFEAGDRVALVSPGYPAYRNILTALDLEVVDLPAGPDTRFQPTAGLLASHHQPIDGLIVASPSNPTGTILAPEEMRDLIGYCAEHGIRLISDEIYHRLTYDGLRAASALEFSDDAVVVNSFSKYYSMTGWRLGWLVVPREMTRRLECLAQNLFINAPTLSQVAGISAFDCTDELEGHLARYGENRDLLLHELPKAGFDRVAPADGAFYIYADVGHLTNDSSDFCKRILMETGVAVTPGADFDTARGHAALRISFAGSAADIAEAARRLNAWKR